MKALIHKVRGIKIITIAVSPGQIQTGRERPLLEAVLKALRPDNSRDGSQFRFEY